MRRTSLFLYSILGVVVAAAACSNQTALSEPGVSASVTSDGSATLVSCTPLPFSSSNAVIGLAGGSITVGPHTFTVPAGALTDGVLITAWTGGESVNAVHFSPAGLEFLAPATLTMSYANCGNWGQLKRLLTVFVDENYNVQEVLTTVVNSSNRTIASPIRHFSIYAVAE